MTTAPPFTGVLFGAAYYAEYQPEGALNHDLDLMAEAGFSVIRVGESVWSTWEPREGEFELDWLEPVLDGARARGIGVILGTPTYAVPMWLARRHPEIAAVREDGRSIGWGGRQEMDQSHPTYRFYAERVARKVVERYAGHPAVIGFQVDNEPGLVLPHNEATFQHFVDWLQARYGTIENLNAQWGLVYWSHRLSSWADLWRPEGNKQPQYDLEWRRFQATLATDLIGWQADMVREYKRDDQFVTTCISYGRPQIEDDQVIRSLDVTAGNPYYLMQRGLDWGRDEPRFELWQHESVWGLFQWADRAWSSGQSPFLVTETNAQSTGQTHGANFPPYPGQIKQAALALISRGGRMIEYWHWHTLHFGIETYWGGVLPHSQRPGRIYREVADLGVTLKAIGSALDDYVPDADVLMVWSTATEWSFESFSPLETEGQPDGFGYRRIFDAHYRGFVEVGTQVRVMHPSQLMQQSAEALVAQFPVLVAPGLYVADDALLQHLRAYAEAGGHLVLGIRTGYGDELARARRAVAPAHLDEAAGTWYDEYTSLVEPLRIDTSAISLEPGSAGDHWADVLHIEDAEVLATYEENELGAQAAVTSHEWGAGRVTYIGTVPNPPLARSLAKWLIPQPEALPWAAADAVSIVSGTSHGRRVVFVTNWSGRPAQVIVPADATDLTSHESFSVGDSMHLPPRGVAVLAMA